MRFIRDDTAKYDFVSIFGFLAWLCSTALVFLAVILGVLFLTVGTGRADTREIYNQHVGQGWGVSCYQSKDSGGLSHCVAGTIYHTNSASQRNTLKAKAMAFSIGSPNASLSMASIAIGAVEWSIVPRRKYDVRFLFVDVRDNTIGDYSISCEGGDNYKTIFCAGTDAKELWSNFVVGKSFGVSVNGSFIGAFPLSGSMKATAHLVEQLRAFGGTGDTFGSTFEGTF